MIQEISDALGGIPEGAVYALLGFALLALIVQIAALIDLATRRRVLWDRKWVWALIILFVSNGIGALLWFVLGRRVPQEDEAIHVAPTTNGERTRRAVDVLYGPGDEDRS
jgi:hypothetical protein